ncbi:MAG: hypothetical protein GY842_08220 [bacterium]|nr:hypothetical protein [bacterium]
MNQFLPGRRGWGFTLGLCAASVLLSLSSVHAAELADIMPPETVLYLEWSGADDVRQAHADTAMGKLLAEPEMQRFATELRRGIDRLMIPGKGGAELQQIAMGLQIGRPILQHLWHHRLALSLVGAESTDLGPSFTAVLAIELGDDGNGLVTAIQGLVNMVTMQTPKQTETVEAYTFQRIDLPFLPPIRYGKVDDVFLVTLGADVHLKVLSIKQGTAPSLATNAGFKAARNKLGTRADNTALTLHLDLEYAREQAKPFLLGHTGSEEFPPPLGAILEELGVNRITTLTYVSQFAQGGFRNATFIAASGEAKGVLTLLDAKPLTDEDLYAIPADAPFFSVGNLELARAYDKVVRIAGVFAPERVTQFHELFEQYTELKLREDVIARFDDGWALFDSPSRGGLWFTGFTLVIEATDAEAFMNMLARIVELVRQEVGEEKLLLKTWKTETHTVHYASIPIGPVPVAPAWGAHGNRVVVALYPQMVAQTLEQMASPDVAKRCILANRDFAAGRQRLPAELWSVSYVDTKAGAEDLYKLFLPAATAGFSAATAYGVPLDVTTIPTQDVMTRHLFGDVRGAARDEDGILMVSHGPLPLPIPSLGSGGGGVATSAVLVSILLPSLSRARELSKRLVSASNLSAIGQACQLHGFEHQEKFPPDLQTLVGEGHLLPKQLVSPLDPSEADCSYVYIAGQTMKSAPNNVLAYEPDYDGMGGNVLFVDGHTEWVRPPRHQQVIEETHKRIQQKQEQSK